MKHKALVFSTRKTHR